MNAEASAFPQAEPLATAVCAAHEEAFPTLITQKQAWCFFEETRSHLSVDSSASLPSRGSARSKGRRGHGGNRGQNLDL